MGVREGQAVEIYRNLNRRGLWFSFRDRKTKLVVDRFDLKDGDVAAVKDVTFNISKAGQARVRREKRKNVHALIRGLMCYHHDVKAVWSKLTPWRVKYDPYNNSTFIGVAENGMTIRLKSAKFVTFDQDGVIAWV